MLQPYLIAITGIVSLMIAWVVVQSAWRKTFPAINEDVDALAGRGGCQGCQCQGKCERDTKE